jgi:hypothetical protein
VADLEQAWDALQAATPVGWYVGRPSYHLERDEWLLYAFDPSERAVVGVRSREWTAIGSTELGVVREMARCLALIREGTRAEIGLRGRCRLLWSRGPMGGQARGKRTMNRRIVTATAFGIAGAVLFGVLPAAAARPEAVDCVQPDGRISRGSGPQVGDDVFNDDGAGQSRQGSASPGSSITFRIVIEFDDLWSTYPGERFIVRGGGSAPGYSVKYFRGDNDITDRVVAGTYQTPPMDVGDTHVITARVKPKPSAAEGSKVTRKVKLGWLDWDAYWCDDTVKFTGRTT